MKKKHYLVYKTTNLVNGKVYIGQHQTYDPNDNYLGSGRELKVDIQKFGRENFKREILFDFDTFEEMDNKEKELVTEEFVNREDTYNVRLGGQNPEVDRICAMGREKERQLWKENGEWAKRFRKKLSESMKQKRKEHPEIFSSCGNPLAFLGKHHTEETKQKISEKNSKHVGAKNAAFGRVWIFNEELRQNKFLPKDDAKNYLSCGWKLGCVYDWNKFFNSKLEEEQKTNAKQVYVEEQKRKYTEMYKVYCELGFEGVKEKFGYKFSQPNFVM